MTHIEKKVGIVVVSYNAAKFVNITLGSVFYARNNIKYSLILVDNASNDIELHKIKKCFNQYKSLNENLEWEFISLDKNLGFSGGNNYGTKKLLNDKEITHICLLNSDVIVGDYWLDHFIAYNEPLISCVTNKSDSNQCIPVNYEIEADDCIDDKTGLLNKESFDIVNKFTQNLYSCLGSYAVKTDPTFFCVVMERFVFDQIGFLDETFFPGGFEDDDYCIRAVNNGIVPVVARGLFIHHFGSGSFGALQQDYFNTHSKKNLGYLEQKHNIVWKIRPEKAFESYFFDIQYCYQYGIKSSLQKELLLNYENKLNALLLHYLNENENFININKNISNGEISDFVVIDHQEIKNLWSNIISFAHDLMQSDKEYDINIWNNIDHQMNVLLIMINDLVQNNLSIYKKYCIWLDEQKNNKTDVVPESFSIRDKFKKYIKFTKFIHNFKGIVFLGGYPYKEREKDGYFQRIKVIDSLFQDRWRIYVEEGDYFSNGKWIDRPEKNIIVIRYCGTKKNRIKAFSLILLMVLKCRKVYSHSVLRMHDGFNSKLFKLPFIKRVIDIHGVVPEEFRMYNDFYSAVLFESYEKLAVKKADIVISVTSSMKEYLQRKYMGLIKNRMIVLPIFPAISIYRQNKKYNGSIPTVIYAGGTHKWQQVPKMVHAISKQIDKCSFKFYCPKPEEVIGLFDNAILNNKNLEIASKDQSELFEIYKDIHFGFALREDMIVNNVACPTKLIEYIAMGIVPILESNNIGDFKKYGLQYVSYDDFLNSKLPSEAERNQIAKNNFSILGLLKNERYISSNELYHFLNVEESFFITIVKDTLKKVVPYDSKVYFLLKKYWHKIKKNNAQAVIIPDDEPQANSLPIESYDVIMQVDNFLAGGLENVVIDISTYLQNNGLKVLILVLGSSGNAAVTARDNNIDVYQMGYTDEEYTNLLKHCQVKLVMSHYSIKGAALCSQLSIPLIQVIHNIYMWLNANELKEFQSTIEYTSLFISVSDYAKQYSINRLGTPIGKSYAIPNGIDINKFLLKNKEFEINELKEKYNILNDDFIFLCVSSINHQKNQISLLRSFNIIASKCERAKLILLGPTYESELMNNINNFISQNNLTDRVIYVGYSDKPELYYGLANACVSSAFFEGGPLVLMEALINNVPFISTKTGLLSYIADRKGIYSVMPHIDLETYHGQIWELTSSSTTENELANAMLKIYNDPIKPDLSIDVINKMDRINTYNLYKNVIDKLIRNEHVIEADFENVWTKYII